MHRWTALRLMEFFSSNRWPIGRTIDDANNHQHFFFAGEAQFFKRGMTWRYEETGSLQLHDNDYSANRVYIYEIAAEKLINVRFENGQLFHQINCVQLPKPSFEHCCGSDLYSGGLTVESSSWSMNWKVIGPKKNLIIQTKYGEQL